MLLGRRHTSARVQRVGHRRPLSSTGSPSPCAHLLPVADGNADVHNDSRLRGISELSRSVAGAPSHENEVSAAASINVAANDWMFGVNEAQAHTLSS
jgi:hypothetical protein